MPPIPRSHAPTAPFAPPAGHAGFDHRRSAKRRLDDDWEAEPAGDELWDPDLLDDDEPDPEPGDFWFENDADDV